jgi:16S rRNA (uracil1498-N3)-methyltransferase
LCAFAAGALRVDGEVVRQPRPAALTVGVVIPKSDRPEWIVQKLTEIGIDRVVLLHSERSIVRWDDERGRRHVDKLDKVAVEALQQSRRVWLPEIVGPDAATAWLPRSAVAEPGGRAIAASDHTVLIGPEGGWTEAELSQAAGCIQVSDAILRVETAALVAASQMTTLRGSF